ncbi:TetR/AcrR family transcriptional regulator [Nocardia sp. NPDC127579]|uniref:TetR/AcrR family transcriptional regulator n=1 Tax=Nocardia sp. NPDC127579 TaxID=3345402 RepID=UPI0036392523
MDHGIETARTPGDKWIEEGLRALGAGGPDAVRIEVLAKNLGVTKGGFYGSFADRNALLEAILDRWERASTEETIARAEREGSDPKAMIRRAGLLTFSDDLRPVDLAVRDWARRDAAVAERLRRVDNARIDLLRTMIGTFCADPDEVEARSLLAFCLAIGAHLLAADHGERTRAQVRARASALILDRPADPRP